MVLVAALPLPLVAFALPLLPLPEYTLNLFLILNNVKAEPDLILHPLELVSQIGDLMNIGRIIEHGQHKLLPIIHILIEDKLRAGHTLLKRPAIENRNLKLAHTASQVMGQLAQVSRFELVAVLVGPDVVLQRVVDQ